MRLPHLPNASLALLMSAMFGALAGPAAAGDKPRPPLSVEVALVADAPEVLLAFRVRNVGAVEVVRGELGANTNAIWILCPDGTIAGHESIIDVFPPPGVQWQPAVIRPGEQVAWELSAKSLLSTYADDQPGVYRVYWDFGGVRSDELRLLRRPGRTWRGEPATTRPATRVARQLATPPQIVSEFSRLVNAEGNFQRLSGMVGSPNRGRALTLEQWRQVKLTPEDEAASAIGLRAFRAWHFRQAVRRRWGDRAADGDWPFTRADAAGLAAAAATDGATITYGEHFLTAVITPPDEVTEPRGAPQPQPHPQPPAPRRLRLARDGRAWLVAAESFVVDGRVDPPIARTTQVLQRAAEAVDRGVYASEADAREAMRRDLVEPPATQPGGTSGAKGR